MEEKMGLLVKMFLRSSLVALCIFLGSDSFWLALGTFIFTFTLMEANTTLNLIASGMLPTKTER